MDDREYFIIWSDEDGTHVEGPLSHADVLKKVTPDQYGETDYGKSPLFLDHVPLSDKGCWTNTPEGALLIIKGSIVAPKPVVRVTEYELPSARPKREIDLPFDVGGRPGAHCPA